MVITCLKVLKLCEKVSRENYDISSKLMNVAQAQFDCWYYLDLFSEGADNRVEVYIKVSHQRLLVSRLLFNLLLYRHACLEEMIMYLNTDSDRYIYISMQTFFLVNKVNSSMEKVKR